MVSSLPQPQQQLQQQQQYQADYGPQFPTLQHSSTLPSYESSSSAQPNPPGGVNPVDYMWTVSGDNQNANKPYKCEQCNYGTNILASLRIHQRIHTGNLFRCTICPSYFYQKSRLKHHMDAHAGLLKCPSCGKQYGSKEGLEHHRFKCGAQT